MEYNPQEIEKKWQAYWQENKVYAVENASSKPKFYALDMFPYPSGAGLHVGHPLGYIASDIMARYKRLKGYNVLHPMGFDSFGLPAEQYAIQTGQHPAKTTADNIATFKSQLNKIGFSYDWEREVRTSEAGYYKWTQWIFMLLFNSWYNKTSDKAEDIKNLVAHFKQHGNAGINAVCDEDTPSFSASEWNQYSEKEQQAILMKYRLTYIAEDFVNWCPALMSVLANDEVKDGLSERGGFPVERRKMRQWMMRITAYADRLLTGLDTLDWSEAVKEMQRNWINKSFGAELQFKVSNQDITLVAFTTRPDTIFGVTYVAIAPEHELIQTLTKPEHQAEVEEYVIKAKNRSERERQSDVKTVSGAFTGTYLINPITGENVPLWVSDYVLAGYGTGVVMGVPASDERDFRFANYFNLPIIAVIEGTDIEKEANTSKEGILTNSGFLNGLKVPDAIEAAIRKAEEMKVGKRKVNFKMRDAVFGRQRYWGEPIPVYYKDGTPYLIEESELPLRLPEIDEYRPTESGEPPLARAKNWKYKGQYDYEHTTMPGWAGSSWYFLRYMDAMNDGTFADRKATDYWKQVDLYIGGTEHATGHLLYSRFWTKALYDRGYISFDEPFKKLVNQGMIQGRSNLIYRLKNEKNTFVSADLKDQYETSEIHVDVNIVEYDILDTEAFKKWRPEYETAQCIASEDGKFRCGYVVEKMSKSKHNVVNPDTIVEKYGADTLRLYEMFLGPLENAKPWDTSGIDGVFRFLKKLWRLCLDKEGNFAVSEEVPTAEELKILHKTIKRVTDDIERYSFNTVVSHFMICVNELSTLSCNKKAILSELVVLLSPYAPHIAEEIWHLLGNTKTVFDAQYPICNEAFLIENSFEYPIQINGKLRAKITLPLDMPQADMERAILEYDKVQVWTNGNPPKKIVIVPKKIVNLVV